MAVDKLHKAGQAVGGIKGPKVSGVRKPAANLASNSQVVGDHVARGEKPQAPKMAANVRAGRFGNAAQILGEKKDPVAATVASFEGLPDSVAAALLAKALIDSGVEVA